MRNLMSTLFISMIINLGFIGPQTMAGPFPRFNSKVEIEIGKPIRIKIDEQRVVILRVTKGIRQSVPVTLNILESTCSKLPLIEPVQCQTNYEIQTDTVRFMWERHSDPTLVGKNVEPLMPLNVYLTSVGKYFYPAVHKNFRSWELSCSNLDWLRPQGSNVKQVHVLQINQDGMGENAEIDNSENLTQASSMNLIFDIEGNSNIRLRSIQAASLGAIIFPLGGDNISIILKQEDNSLCQVSGRSPIVNPLQNGSQEPEEDFIFEGYEYMNSSIFLTLPTWIQYVSEHIK